MEYSRQLRQFLESKKLEYRFYEFDEPVKTVEQAAQKVPVERIAKSMVLVDTNDEPLLAIIPAESRVSRGKVKGLLRVKDVRLATPTETLDHSGYPAGGVPPFNKIHRVLLDPAVLKNETSIVGGGDVNMLVEIKTQAMLDLLRPNVANIIQED